MANEIGTAGMGYLDNLQFHRFELENFLASGEAFPDFFRGVSPEMILDYLR